MRTSIDIPDALLAEVKLVMRRRGTTLRDLVTEGLRRAVEDARVLDQKPFVLRDVRFRGESGFAENVSAEDVARTLRDDEGERGPGES